MDTEIETKLNEIAEGNRKKLDEIDKALARLNSPQLCVMDEGNTSPEHKTFMSWVRGGDKAISPAEHKTLTIGSDPSFGYAVPAELSRDIIHTMTEGNPLRPLVKTYNTSNTSLEVLKRSASGAVAFQTTETSEMTETAGLAYAKLTYTPKTSYYLLKVGVNMLEDAKVDMNAEIAQELGDAFGTFEANECVNGTAGLIANIGDGTLNTYKELHVGSTSALDADKIMDLLYTLPSRYRAGASWMMSGATFSKVRQLKSATTNMYLFTDFTAPEPRLLGYPVILNENMPAVTSSLYPIGFGNWSRAFAICDRYPQFTLQRLNEKYAEYGIVGFLARMRSVCGPLDGAAAVFLQMAT